MNQDLLGILRRHFPRLDAVPDDCVLTGGPVRDALLGRTPTDLDFATPDAGRAAATFARRSGGRRVTLGTRLKTERVVADGKIYDFSPLQGGSLESDLGRRDFTMNAVALDLRGTLIDPFEGREDIGRKLVRMISESNLIDDPLRILRAPRMSGAFGFTLDAATAEACRWHRGSLESVARERIGYELRLILIAPHPRRAGEDLSSLGLDRITLGFPLELEDLGAWENLEDRSGDDATASVIALLFSPRPSHLPSFLERWPWKREETRNVISILRVIEEGGGDDSSLLITAAEEGRSVARRAEKILRTRGRVHEAERLRAILGREPSPFDVAPFLDGHEIASLTGARGPAIGRWKRKLWEKQVLGEIRTIEEAAAFVLSENQ